MPNAIKKIKLYRKNIYKGLNQNRQRNHQKLYLFSNKMDSKKLMLPNGQMTIFYIYILKFVKYQTKTSGKKTKQIAGRIQKKINYLNNL